ncbi:hypothetical protein GCM10007103_09850 [Salinimicrobium marinum]|uniref:Putative zinc-finger domain-containing protein n=1 Tax=Salinimicrobium marinum TaxID=680283 RepID=A0A918SBH5_9FLAO|nr:HEAT repeat domain-containing protein [Salinimicrobium marinum]GHA30476.1 hypothetical protein GCM10007103_09850 [Salinimicrobium marinum]
MKCKEVQAGIFDYLEGQLSEGETKGFESHLAHCASCTKEVVDSKILLETMDTIPLAKPDKGHKKSFEEMLEREKQILYHKKDSSTIQPHFWKTAFQIAATILLVLTGYLYGEHRGTQVAQTQISQLTEQSQELKTEMTLAMLDNRSASKRIQAVNYSEDLQIPDNKVLEAIIGRLRHDDNVNVRLAAAGTLSRFQDNHLVKDAFIAALGTEENPDVQIAVIQFLAYVKEERSVAPMKKLLNQPEVPDYVKLQVNQGLAQIL